MKKFVLITLFIPINFIYCQNLKLYNGKFGSGIATYEYYENSGYERIFNGKFKYTSARDNLNLSGAHIPSGIEVIGNYKENMKTGLWTATQRMNSYVPSKGNVIIITSVNGKFQDGKREGKWIFTSLLKTEKKEVNYKAVFNFNKDVLFGPIDYSDIKGTLDSEGHFINNWTLKDNGVEYLAEFKNNTFIRLIKRRISDGEIFFKFDNEALINLFFQTYKSDDDIVRFNDKDYCIVYANKMFNKRGIKYPNDNSCFKEFFSLLLNKIKDFDINLKEKEVELGSTDFILNSPKVILEYGGTGKKEERKK